MINDVFISYSQRDRAIAFTLCAVLESKHIRCWIAPRDILPGEDWGGAIINAIDHSRLMVLVFSAESNRSEQVKREVQNAVESGLTIVPLRIEDVAPSNTLRYFLGTQHWLDALTQPLDRHLEDLARTLQVLLARRNSDGPTPDAGTAERAAAASTTEAHIEPNGAGSTADRCVVLLLDQSLSMAEPLAGCAWRKCDVVADAVNAWLEDAIDGLGASKPGGGGVDVAVIGYGTDDHVQVQIDRPLSGNTGRFLVPLAEVAACPAEVRAVPHRSPGTWLDGFATGTQPRVWGRPLARGGTPICHVLYKTHEVVASWVQDHPMGCAPTVIHISDGESQDGHPLEYAEAIHRLATRSAPTRMYNCLLSSSGGRTVLFPNRRALPDDDLARTLFQMSTELSFAMMQRARSEHVPVSPGARGLGWEADYGTFLHFLRLIARET